MIPWKGTPTVKEHRCSMEKGKLTCSTLIETNTEGLPKYIDERGRAYKDIESFQDRLELPEIEIQECQRETFSPPTRKKEQ